MDLVSRDGCAILNTMHRRSFLLGLASVSLLPSCSDGDHSPLDSPSTTSSSPRVKSVAQDARGTTLTLGLESAPFAAEGYEDDSVLVFIPAHYRYSRDEGVSVVTHFHGHFTTVEQEVATYELRKQFAESHRNAMLIVPQLAVMAADSWCGKLERPGSFASLLAETIAASLYTASAMLGDTPFPANAPLGTVCVSARAGGYHAAASCLRHGGVDVHEAYLFDALYGDLDVFYDWVVAGTDEPIDRRRRLVSYSTEGGFSEAQSRDLSARLERVQGALMHEGWRTTNASPERGARFVRTSPRPDWGLTWERQALGKVLAASPLRRSRV